MKKTISLILTVVMLCSCFFSFSVSAEENSLLDGILSDITNMENFENAVINSTSGFEFPEEGDMEIDQMISEGLITGEMLGLSVDFLYNSKSDLLWKDVSVTKDDVALASANLNAYLKRVLYNKYGGFNLYSMKNNAASVYATKIANFLGNMFYPNFEEVTIQFKGTETVTEDEFYGEIVSKSGFGNVLQYNWCNQGSFDFRPMIETWGLSTDKVLKSEYYDGFRLGKKLVSAVINKFLAEGPISAFMSILNIYSKSYMLYLYDATAALFSAKIAAGVISPEELETIDGLMNLIVNNNNPNDTQKLQFVVMPSDRFRIAKDNTELFLYFIVYSNINCRYKNNTNVIEGYKQSINDDKIDMIIDVLLMGDLTKLISQLGNLFQENLQQTPTDLLSRIANTFSRFIKMIADYFDNLFAIIMGEKEFPRP